MALSSKTDQRDSIVQSETRQGESDELFSLRETSRRSFEIASEKRTTQHLSILAPVSERNREPRSRLGVNSRRNPILWSKPPLICNISA
jgi:hypothetical protein